MQLSSMQLLEPWEVVESMLGELGVLQSTNNSFL